MFVAPAFYNVKEFAEMFGVSEDHIRHGAKNFMNPGHAKHRAKLPDGYGAFIWGGIIILFGLSDATAIEKMFNVKVRRVRDRANV